MKLLRYRYQNSIKPAIVDDENNIRDVSSIIEDWTGNTINDETINIVKNSDINKFSIIFLNLILNLYENIYNSYYSYSYILPKKMITFS